MRAVLDANVLISALIGPVGAPRAILAHWRGGTFELVVSERLLAEVERTLALPRLRRYVSAEDAAESIALLRSAATLLADPAGLSPRTSDPDDDYLIALAETSHALLVSGDKHVLALRGELPIRTPREFRAELGSEPDS